jgi:salicylate hydroxylase
LEIIMEAIEQHKIIIVGAGPGGLCAALALEQRGVDCVIFEKATSDQLFSDVGGGYDLSPNTLAMLDNVEVGAEVRRSGERFSTVKLLTSDGKELSSFATPSDLDATSMRRSTLQQVLLAKLGNDRVRTGTAIGSVDQDDDGVTVRLSNGEVHRGALLIGADGIHSVARRCFGDDEPLHFCNVTCVWGRVEGHRAESANMIPPDSAMAYLGRGATFMAGVCEGEILWSAFWRCEAFAKSSNAAAAQERVLARFRDWHPRVVETIRASDEGRLAEVGIFDRGPSRSWSKGRVILIGDAAHPMTPFLGQGANSAMIDAFVLADAVARLNPIEAAKAYEMRRKLGIDRNVRSARQLCDWMTSNSQVKNLATRWLMRAMPDAWMIRSLFAADRINDVSDLWTLHDNSQTN